MVSFVTCSSVLGPLMFSGTAAAASVAGPLESFPVPWNFSQRSCVESLVSGVKWLKTRSRARSAHHAKPRASTTSSPNDPSNRGHSTLQTCLQKSTHPTRQTASADYLTRPTLARITCTPSGIAKRVEAARRRRRICQSSKSLRGGEPRRPTDRDETHAPHRVTPPARQRSRIGCTATKPHAIAQTPPADHPSRDSASDAKEGRAGDR